MERQSFGELICDDVCEEILQYLPFNDKFRLECVSQQFQRTIFRRLFALITIYSDDDIISFDTFITSNPLIEYLTVNYYTSDDIKFNLVLNLIL